MRTTQTIVPGSGFHQIAAQHIWTFLDVCTTQDETQVQQAVIVVPTAAQIGDLRTALALASSNTLNPRFIPRIVTLGHWLQDLVPEPNAPAVRSQTARLLSVQQTLKENDWLRKTLGAHSDGALWSLAQSLITVCDELAEEWLVAQPQQSLQYDKVLQKALESAFNRLHQHVLGDEATLVLTFWRHLTSVHDPIPARWQQLQRLAAQTEHPVIWCAPTAPTTLEAHFLQRLAQQAPVLELGYDWALQHNALQTPHADLLRCWPELQATSATQGDANDVTTVAATVAAHIHLLPAKRFEDEATQAAQAVLQALEAGEGNIALIAQDRVVARRVRALLARCDIPVRDETGWKLSTTRAAAALMAWFDVVASGMQQGPEGMALLDFLKSPFTLPDLPERSRSIAQLESLMRREGVTGGWQRLRSMVAQVAQQPDTTIDEDELPFTDYGAFEALSSTPPAIAPTAPVLPQLSALENLLETLYTQAKAWAIPTASMAQWSQLLERTLDVLGLDKAFAQDEAGRQLLQALAGITQLVPEGAPDLFGDAQLGRTRLTAQEWRALVSVTIESATYREPMPSGAIRVTLLPLNGARMRRFDRVIVVGCDDQQLPSKTQDALFFSNQLRRELQLPDREKRYAQQARDLAEVLLNNPQVVATWQTQSATGEPKRLTPWFARLQASVWPINVIAPSAQRFDTTAAQCFQPQPAAPDLVLHKLSASAYNTLRRCPYQFYVQRMLGLQALDDMHEEVEKRHFGQWLHQILFTYHQTIPANADRITQDALLMQISAEVFNHEMAKDGHAVRYWPRWQSAMPKYLDWQQSVTEQGWKWEAGELKRQQALPLADGKVLQLVGQLDRIDSHIDGLNMVRDYKTQTADALKKKRAEPGEDCQLPFYALLMPGIDEGTWIPLEGKKIVAVGLDEGQKLDALAEQLKVQICHDFNRLYQGEALPALGDEAACRYCEMRGLCRKGTWAERNVIGQGDAT